MILSGFYREREGGNSSLNELVELSSTRDILSRTTRDRFEDEIDASFQYSADYTNKFDDKGHELTARFQYEESAEEEISSIEAQSTFPNPIPPASKKIDNLEDQKRMLLQADYVWPIDEKTQFELGYRGNFNTQKTDYQVAFLDDGIPIIDTNLSNVLVYKEFVNAAYTQFGKRPGNFPTCSVCVWNIPTFKLTKEPPTTIPKKNTPIGFLQPIFHMN